MRERGENKNMREERKKKGFGLMVPVLRDSLWWEGFSGRVEFMLNCVKM